MTDDDQREPVRYAYKPSVAGAPQTFELTGQGLSYKSGYRSGDWRYADVARIRLSYRPVSMLAHRFRADLQHKDGGKLTIISATWAGIVALTPQNDSYRAFIEELHRRVAAERSGVVCLAGTNKVVFALSCAVFAAVMIALAVMFVRALMTGEHMAALFMLGFAAWFGWYTGRMLMRNKPRSYDPAHVPRELLP
ncbi:hypothetical protein [Bradyrhizobium sp. LHD-71]|uniref:hypothetical protein n=1 Tax=Bradyrhizobium sp. LHD-71 TaxID=3072141 RepID=UPI00280D4163|nr:hypothetical protein [Bradyrhizobium sp. LHD-71]MDQ8728530.1 hypothetical protein [Bradyrhizobium sp. LHD-71]